MRLNQGRIGAAESISAAALSLFMGGVFAIDPKTAYAEGNLTYLSAPLSMLLSLLVILLASGAIRRNGCSDLTGLAGKLFGRHAGTLFAAVLAASFVIAAAKPVSEFIMVLHRLVFDGVSYGSIYVFIIPAAVYAAWKGFESIGRLALVFSGLILVSVIAAVASAAPEFDAGRLFPFPGTDAKGFFGSVFSGMLFTLPPLAALAVNARGVGGAERISGYAASGAVIAAFITGITQFALALIYPPKVLAGLLMPLYRINYLSLSQSYALRLDKLFIMIWLAGCIVSAAYLVYSASFLLTGALGGRDVTPFVMTLSLAAAAVSAIGFAADNDTAEAASGAVNGFGFLLALLPLAAAAVFGYLRKGKIA